jgi:hypothetical protein
MLGEMATSPLRRVPAWCSSLQQDAIEDLGTRIQSTDTVRCLNALLAAVLVVSCTSCSNPSEQSIYVDAIFELHHEIIRRLPDDVECEMVGFSTHQTRIGLEAVQLPADALTWQIIPRRIRTDDLVPILFRLRVHPAGALPMDKCFLRWKGLEVEVLWESKDPRTTDVLEMLGHPH